MSLPDSNLSDVQVGDTVYLEQIAGGFQARYSYAPLTVARVTKTQINAVDQKNRHHRLMISTGEPVGAGRDAWSRNPRIFPATPANAARASELNKETAEKARRDRFRWAIIELLKDNTRFAGIPTEQLDAAHAALCGMETVTAATEETN